MSLAFARWETYSLVSILNSAFYDGTPRWAHWHLLFPKTTDIKYLSRRNVKTVASWHFFHTSCSLLNDVNGRCPVHSGDGKAWWRFRPNNPSVWCLRVRDAGCYLASASVQMLSMKIITPADKQFYICAIVIFIKLLLTYLMPSVLWHCWLGGRKGIRPVKNGGMVEVGTG